MIAGQKVGQRYAISKRQGTIGRGPSNSVQVIDVKVSRIHCRYQVVGDRLEVADLESANGTFVNGEAVEHSTLGNGDQLKIGSTIFEVKINATEESTAGTDFSIQEKFPARRMPSSLSYFPMAANLYQDDQHESGMEDSSGGPVSMAQVVNDMSFIYHASLVTSGRANQAEMFAQLIDLIFSWVTADRCGVLLRDRQTGEFNIEAMESRSMESSQQDLAISQSIVNYVCKHRVGILTSDALEDQRLPSKDSIKRIGVREAICVPINGRNTLLGVIYIDALNPERKPDVDRFNKNHLKLSIAIGLQIGFAIENDRYFERLLEQQRMVTIGQTTSSLSHRLKNVLQSVNGGAHLVETGLKAENLKTIETGWAIVKRNQQEISKMVNDMLVLGKPYDPHFSQADLSELITSVVTEIEPSLITRNIQHEWTPSHQPVFIRIDPRGVHWALYNLINSCAAACRGQTHGKIDVSLDCSSSQHVVITIADNSPKVEPSENEDALSLSVPEPAHNMNPVELAVSRKLIEGHKGNVSLTHPESGGNLFVIQLPLEHAETC